MEVLDKKICGGPGGRFYGIAVSVDPREAAYRDLQAAQASLVQAMAALVN